jgi:cytochrome c oxidase cbb3-type subunit 3
MKYTVLSFVAVLALSSCEAPGRPAADARVVRPAEVADFERLYSQNCSGCHGKDGQGALTVGIGRPVYLAIADDATIRRTIEEGRPGTAMPAFAQKAGGMLTDAQIAILVRGMRERWAKAGAFESENLHPYASSRPGDAAHGQEVFAACCASCHGSGGRGARAVADSSYLSLVTDQHLRTVIIVGMPNLGMPDRRSHSKPLSDADVTDVVTWLAAQRQSKSLSAQMSH